MGLKPSAKWLSKGDEALAERTADLVGAQFRAALWEDRQIRAGKMHEIDPATLNDV